MGTRSPPRQPAELARRAVFTEAHLSVARTAAPTATASASRATSGLAREAHHPGCSIPVTRRRTRSAWSRQDQRNARRSRARLARFDARQMATSCKPATPTALVSTTPRSARARRSAVTSATAPSAGKRCVHPAKHAASRRVMRSSSAMHRSSSSLARAARPTSSASWSTTPTPACPNRFANPASCDATRAVMGSKSAHRMAWRM